MHPSVERSRRCTPLLPVLETSSLLPPDISSLLHFWLQIQAPASHDSNCSSQYLRNTLLGQHLVLLRGKLLSRHLDLNHPATCSAGWSACGSRSDCWRFWYTIRSSRSR